MAKTRNISAFRSASARKVWRIRREKTIAAQLALAQHQIFNIEILKASENGGLFL